MKNPFINTASALATVIALATTANAQQGSTQVITDIESSPKSVAEANAAAAAAAQAQANNNNLVVVSPYTAATANGGNAQANGGTGVATANGHVTTRVANNTSINHEAQAATPGSIIITPTSQCGQGFGFAAGVVGGSLSASGSNISFRCVDTHAALALFQASTTIEERGVALATLANLSPAFDEAITSVAQTSLRCEAEMRQTSSVLLAAGQCRHAMVPGRD